MIDLVRIPAPVSFERMGLSPALDDTFGTNWATDNRPQIAAQNDIDALKAWLARVADTRTIFENYRKEVERLLL